MSNTSRLRRAIYYTWGDLFFQNGRLFFQRQDAPWCLCWHSSLQLPSHDPSMDVPNGPHLWQHLHNEGLNLERATLIILTIVSQARETPQRAWPLLSCSRRQVGNIRHFVISEMHWTWLSIWFCVLGCPDGVVNVIHGQHDTVNFICDHPDIRAVSFVGGDAAGKHIYERGSANGKRVQVWPP